MNVAVINVKDLFKFLFGCLVIIGVMVIVHYSLKNNKEDNQIKQKIEEKAYEVKQYAFIECIQMTLPKISTNKKEMKDKNESLAYYIFNKELGMAKNMISISDLVIDKEELTMDDVDEIIATANTEVIEEKNIKTRYTNSYNKVEIRNESDYSLTEEMLLPNVEFSNKKDIILFHTHTCESYTPSEQYSYEMTGSYRTTDLNFTVSKVGDELAQRLEKKGYNVIHDKTYHDYPAYSGSYNRSLTTVEELLKNTKADLVIDLHRDAVGNGSEYGPTVKINDEYAAQLMFVIGTDGGGLEHPNWQENLKLAIKVQEKANELYPGLFRPIMVRNSRYNQHLAKGACIIEVGATGNTLEQTLVSMKYLANVISEVMK